MTRTVAGILTSIISHLTPVMETGITFIIFQKRKG